MLEYKEENSLYKVFLLINLWYVERALCGGSLICILLHVIPVMRVGHSTDAAMFFSSSSSYLNIHQDTKIFFLLVLSPDASPVSLDSGVLPLIAVIDESTCAVKMSECPLECPSFS